MNDIPTIEGKFHDEYTIVDPAPDGYVYDVAARDEAKAREYASVLIEPWSIGSIVKPVTVLYRDGKSKWYGTRWALLVRDVK